MVARFHYVGKCGNQNPVVFNYCYGVVYSSGICRVESTRVVVSSWHFLLTDEVLDIVESVRGSE